MSLMKRLRSKLYFTGIMAVLLTLALAACGDPTATTQPVSVTATATNAVTTAATTQATTTALPTVTPVATTVPATTSATPTPAVTTAVATTPATTVATTTPATTPATTSGPQYKPVLKASTLEVKIGGQVTLTGSGYPANTELEVNGGVQNPALKYGKVKTDGQGKFTFPLNLDVVSYVPGSFTFEAGTPDRSIGAIVTVTLLSDGHPQTVKFTQDFFNALTRNDDQNATKYLSAKLQMRVQNEHLTLGQLLGLARQPSTVEVSELNGKQYNVQALMHFAGGDYILYLQVLNDTNGQLKIIDFGKPFAA